MINLSPVILTATVVAVAEAGIDHVGVGASPLPLDVGSNELDGKTVLVRVVSSVVVVVVTVVVTGGQS